MDHMSDVFDDKPLTATTDQVETKTPTVEELLARLANKDQFIDQLKGETAGLREELNQRVGAEDLFRKIVETKPEPTTQVVTAPKEPDRPVGDPNQVDLAQQISDAIEAKDQERVGRANAEAVARRLVEVYGSEEGANQAVRAKALELGVSVKWLQDIAVQSPKAFFATTSLEASRPAPVPAPRGDVNLAGLKPTDTGSSTPGTKAYYDALRRDNPAKYWEPSTQNAIHKAAIEGTYIP